MNVWYTKQHVKKPFSSIWRVSYLGITGRKQYICVKNANTRWQSRRTCAHLLLQELQNYNSLLNTSTGECWLPQKRYSISKAKGEAPIWWHLESNSMPQYDGISNRTPCRLAMLGGLKKTLFIARPRDPTETEPDLPLCVWVSPVEIRDNSGLPQEQGLWVQQTSHL